MRHKLGWLGLALLAGGALLVVALVGGRSPAAGDRLCSPGYRRCMSRAVSLAGRLDCRVERYHCRIDGPGHWGAVHD